MVCMAISSTWRQKTSRETPTVSVLFFLQRNVDLPSKYQVSTAQEVLWLIMVQLGAELGGTGSKKEAMHYK